MSFVSDFVTNFIRVSRHWTLRFDGRSFKTEPSSNYPHKYETVLGLYKGMPFVTGSYTVQDTPNKKTEILDHTSKQWNVVDDYPFAGDGDR